MPLPFSGGSTSNENLLSPFTSFISFFTLIAFIAFVCKDTKKGRNKRIQLPKTLKLIEKKAEYHIFYLTSQHQRLMLYTGFACSKTCQLVTEQHVEDIRNGNDLLTV